MEKSSTSPVSGFIMASTTIRVITLGTHSDLDTDERTLGAERAVELVGSTFGSQDSPLAHSIVDMSLNDGNNNNNVAFNTANGSDKAEYVSINGTNYYLDGGVIYLGTVTYMDGTSASDIPLRILQDTTGHLVLVPPPTSASATEIQGVTSKAIQSITLNSVSNSQFTGLDTSRYGLANAPVFVCFRSGTLIDTDRGERPIESLRPGDLVMTQDNGLQPIRWIGTKQLDRALLRAFPRLRPVRIPAGALGPNLPARDLWVSQQHRILIRSRIAEHVLGETEVLVAAKFLIGIGGIQIDDSDTALSYHHMLFDRHEIVLSEGARTESLFTGPEALKSVPVEARAEILALFPELINPANAPQPIRRISTGRQGRELARRHAIKQRDLQSLRAL